MYAYERYGDDQRHFDTPRANRGPGRQRGLIGRARRATRAFTARLTPVSGPDGADTLVLVVSELATNALRHGGGTFALRLNVHPDAIEVAADDTSPRLPRMRTPDLTGAGGGFGWPMVNRHARTTAITRRPAGGKTVTAFLPF
ncbi:ATP-binding protein [Streptomyces sp. NBC_01220]|uniref:ATP-binding protein n=1 Tax=unclassified Streptomyces TaxID=2593676 RepID=UPI002E2D6746|nr:ATP-binding protein [Streptomyces sp. NBC_00184]WSQ42724.1 ATP-binding protein [Streptomyces sp. NBC_01220]